MALRTPTSGVQLKKLIALTGATGYVGGRLLPLLLERGYHVRCLTRRPEAIAHLKGPACAMIQADALDEASVLKGLRGCHTAYYLVHSMGAGPGFEERDRQAARHFAGAAKRAGVKRVVYLGGLGRDQDALSTHLASRHEVGAILAAEGPPCLELRASIVIGAGSLSFEMVRALVERLPVMITPRWVSIQAQPIAISDLLKALLAAAGPGLKAGILEVGGPERVSYGELMLAYAKVRGLRRFMLPVPLLTPWLSSLWLGLVTPLYARVGRSLISSLRNPTLVEDPAGMRALRLKPMGVEPAIRAALAEEDEELASRWTDALSSAAAAPTAREVGPDALIEEHRLFVPLKPEQAFKPVLRLGGKHGWLHANILWRLRGWADLLAGGVGIRRGRRHPQRLKVGEALDWWRVEAVGSTRLRLRAEMLVPGRAWLSFRALPAPGGSVLVQTALFDPLGLAGRL